LLRQQKGDTLLVVELPDNFENLFHQLRCQTHAGLIKQNHFRAAHQGAADRAHLLFAAGCVARLALAPFTQPWKIRVDHFKVGPYGRVPVPPGISTGEEILLNGQVPETVAAFHDLNAAAPDQLVWRQCLHLVSVEMD